MAVEMQVFVGYLFVVGGRAVRMPPPGGLAETAPKRAPRAREGDTFVILVTPAVESRAPASFFEELAQLGADVYFGSSGGITGGLREALTAINVRLLTLTGSPAVNALALVLRGEELYAARGGTMVGALRQESGVTFFPAQPVDPLEVPLAPLGSGLAPDIQLTRFSVAAGQVMLVAEASLLGTGTDAVSSALQGEGIAAILERLKPLAGQQAAASVIRFAAPGTIEAAGSAPQLGTRAPRVSQARTTKPPAPDPAPTPPAAVPEAPPAVVEVVAAPPPVETAPPAAPFAEEPAPPPPGPVMPFVEDVEPVEAEEPVGRLGRLRETGQQVRRHGPSVLTRARFTIRRTVRDLLRTILAALLGTFGFFSGLLERILPAPGEDGRQGIPTNAAIAMAVMIPIVIVVAVLGLVLSGYDRSEFEDYLERAQQQHDEATRLAAGKCDNQALRPMWIEALRLAEMAEEFRPSDPSVQRIRADAQNYLDCYDVVERRDLRLLRVFPEDADLLGPIVHDGVDMYVLDRTRDAVYHDTLNENGDGLTTSDDDPIIWRGQVIVQHTVGDLFDLDWLDTGGTAHDNVLIALDRSGVLVAYSPTFFATAQQLVIEGRWVQPKAIAVFRSNLYVLDVGANQVWRYVPPAGERRYSAAPDEYFNGDVLPDLSKAVDFGISEQGAVYVLFEDGTMQSFRRNVQGYVEGQPFNYQLRPPGAITSGGGLFVDNDPASLQLYILDVQNDTIYETLLAGRFQRGYRPRNLPDAFHDLKGFYADAVERNNMYVIAGNRLYHFRRNQ